MWQALSIVLIAAHVVEPCLPSGDDPNYSRDDRNLTAEEISNKLISVNLHFEAELDERMLGKTKLKIGVTQNPLTTNCQGYNAQSQLHDFVFHCDINYPNVTLELIELKGIFASDHTFRRLPNDRFEFVQTDMPATAQYRWQRVEGQPTTVRLEKISLKESSVAFAKKCACRLPSPADGQKNTTARPVVPQRARSVTRSVNAHLP
ncbi:hypothetical protein SprV_0702423100 [Sparganum proliferum]